MRVIQFMGHNVARDSLSIYSGGPGAQAHLGSVRSRAPAKAGATAFHYAPHPLPV